MFIRRLSRELCRGCLINFGRGGCRGLGPDRDLLLYARDMLTSTYFISFREACRFFGITSCSRSLLQVLLRWAVQKGIAVTPASRKAPVESVADPRPSLKIATCCTQVERLKENLEVLNFKLEDEDLYIAAAGLADVVAGCISMGLCFGTNRAQNDLVVVEINFPERAGRNL